MYRYWTLMLFSFLLTSCQSGNPPAAAPVKVPASVVTPIEQKDDRPIILAFGDSLTAGYGVAHGFGYPELLQRRLDEKGYRYRVLNAGISGDTTSGGLGRLDAALKTKPAIVILELGGNDGLRGLPVAQTRANLEEMILSFQHAGAQVILERKNHFLERSEEHTSELQSHVNLVC